MLKKNLVVAACLGLGLGLGLCLFGATAARAADCASEFGNQGYSCMDVASGQDCRPGYCPGGTNIQCCRPGNGILPQATGKQSDCKNPATGNYDANYCGDYAVNDFIALGINVAKWVMGIVGSLALIMFIYGGFMFLISGGSSEKVEKAKKIIIAAVIGLVIVFASYLIIKFVMQSMGLTWSGGIGSGNACDTNFGNQGYTCMDEALGKNCRTGYCPGGTNIQCCQPN
ncbi:MAG: pilin [Patescibacteria group bacterium]